jgi:hypothetical protein
VCSYDAKIVQLPRPNPVKSYLLGISWDSLEPLVPEGFEDYLQVLYLLPVPNVYELFSIVELILRLRSSIGLAVPSWLLLEWMFVVQIQLRFETGFALPIFY